MGLKLFLATAYIFIAVMACFVFFVTLREFISSESFALIFQCQLI